AEIVVEADEHHDAILIIENGAPVRRRAVGTIAYTAAPPRLPVAGLLLGRKIVDGVEERVIVGKIDDGPVGKDTLDAGFEAIPFARAKETVAQQKTAPQQIFLKLLY